MKKRLFLSAAVAMGITLQGVALPADPTPRVVTQPDGTTLTIVMHGDEYGSYITTLDGDIVQRDADGFFRYSTMEAGRCVASKYIARDNDENNSQIESFVNKVDKQAIINQVRTGIDAKRQKMAYDFRPEGAPLRQMARAKNSEETTKVKGLVILAEFQDVKFSENGTKANFESLLNEEGNNYMGGIGSARDYFIDQSFGQFEPTFDVIGPITLPENEAYYGKPEDGMQGGDNNSQVYYLPLHACDVAFEQGLCNFSDYDCNNDGKVDLVFVIYAGYAESSGAPNTTIWPHAAWVGSTTAAKERIYDGVSIDAYACTSELAGTTGTDLYGIGAICHEFSHTLGLPDWYDTKGFGGFGMNKWSVMDQGCHNAGGRIPCGYNAYEREFCGWTTITELTEPSTLRLENVATGGAAYKVVADNNPDRYFTFETRVKSSWDQHLPAEGLLIIKVDYDADAWSLDNNSVNTLSNRQRFQFVPADNKCSVDNFETDVWPQGDQNSFSDETTPKMKIHLTTIKNKPVTNIRFDSANKVSTFNFKGGDAAVEDVMNEENVVYSNGHEIVINTTEATEAYIYNVQGMRIATVNVANGTAIYRPTAQGVYIVQCGNKCNKVSL